MVGAIPELGVLACALPGGTGPTTQSQTIMLQLMISVAYTQFRQIEGRMENGQPRAKGNFDHQTPTNGVCQRAIVTQTVVFVG